MCLLIQHRQRVSEDSAIDLYQVHDTWRLLDQIKFDYKYSYFSYHSDLKGVLRSFAICCHHGTSLSSFMVKSDVENAMVTEI
jgi:hypothetical protein